MTENQIKVYNLEELISKVQEYVASQGEPEKVSLGKTTAVSETLNYTKDKGWFPTKKGGVEVKLNGENSSVNFFLEAKDKNKGEEEKVNRRIGFKPGEIRVYGELLKKVLAELNKIIPDKRTTLPSNKNPGEKDNSSHSHSSSIVAIPCSNLGEVNQKGIGGNRTKN